MKPLEELIRPNIAEMKPYSSARDEFHGEASVFLDANENPWNAPYNRYPDPLQQTLKERISLLKGVVPERIFIGNGSDEPIDLLLRAFCEPGEANILSIAPSYGMYEVAANLNNAKFVKVLLDSEFKLNSEALLKAADEQTKVIFLCSPNNPSGNLLNREEIYRVLEGFEGIVVVDEAYIDFAVSPSFLGELNRYPNLVVLQTLSKAWGAAGIRLGMAFASTGIVAILNKIKYPYNINQLTQEEAIKVLEGEAIMQKQVALILSERERMTAALQAEPFAYKVYPSDANFILVSVGNADERYKYLVNRGIVVRNRTNISLCEGCLRITIGTPNENDLLLQAMKEYTK